MRPQDVGDRLWCARNRVSGLTSGLGDLKLLRSAQTPVVTRSSRIFDRDDDLLSLVDNDRRFVCLEGQRKVNLERGVIDARRRADRGELQRQDRPNHQTPSHVALHDPHPSILALSRQV